MPVAVAVAVAVAVGRRRGRGGVKGAREATHSTSQTMSPYVLLKCDGSITS